MGYFLDFQMVRGILNNFRPHPPGSPPHNLISYNLGNPQNRLAYSSFYCFPKGFGGNLLSGAEFDFSPNWLTNLGGNPPIHHQNHPHLNHTNYFLCYFTPPPSVSSLRSERSIASSSAPPFRACRGIPFFARGRL